MIFPNTKTPLSKSLSLIYDEMMCVLFENLLLELVDEVLFRMIEYPEDAAAQFCRAVSQGIIVVLSL